MIRIDLCPTCISTSVKDHFAHLVPGHPIRTAENGYHA